MSDHEAWVHRIANAAREFLNAYNEFWPDEPGAFDEFLQQLVSVVDSPPEEQIAWPEPEITRRTAIVGARYERPEFSIDEE